MWSVLGTVLMIAAGVGVCGLTFYVWGWRRGAFGRDDEWRELILDALHAHSINPTMPRGVERIGGLTQVWGLHSHQRTTDLNTRQVTCPCGAIEYAGEWYLPESHARAAEEAVIDTVRRAMHEPSLAELRTRERRASEQAMVPPRVGVATMDAGDDPDDALSLRGMGVNPAEADAALREFGRAGVALMDDTPLGEPERML